MNGDGVENADPTSPGLVFSSGAVLEDLLGLSANERRAFILAMFKTKRMKRYNHGESKDYVILSRQ